MRRGERDVTIVTIMIWNKKHVDLNTFGGVVVKLAKERSTKSLTVRRKMALILFISLLMVPHRCFSSSELKKKLL